MIMNKKGISPLIATVLILGFTVALAAVIMTWGTSFTKDMQKTTKETADIQVVCATDVDFDIKSVCYNEPNSYKILIQNDGTENIIKWKFRVFEDDTKAESVDSSTSVSAFGLGQITITTSGGLDAVRKIEAIPIIQKSGSEVVCSQTVDSYGDSSGSNITTACS